MATLNTGGRETGNAPPAASRNENDDFRDLQSSANLQRAVTIAENVLRASDFYQIIGAPRNAGEDRLRGAFRDLALRIHPDKFLNVASPDELKLLNNALVRVNEANSCLTDPVARRSYDRGLPPEARLDLDIVGAGPTSPSNARGGRGGGGGSGGSGVPAPGGGAGGSGGGSSVPSPSGSGPAGPAGPGGPSGPGGGGPTGPTPTPGPGPAPSAPTGTTDQPDFVDEINNAGRFYGVKRTVWKTLAYAGLAVGTAVGAVVCYSLVVGGLTAIGLGALAATPVVTGFAVWGGLKVGGWLFMKCTNQMREEIDNDLRGPFDLAVQSVADKELAFHQLRKGAFNLGRELKGGFNLKGEQLQSEWHAKCIIYGIYTVDPATNTIHFPRPRKITISDLAEAGLRGHKPLITAKEMDEVRNWIDDRKAAGDWNWFTSRGLSTTINLSAESPSAPDFKKISDSFFFPKTKTFLTGKTVTKERIWASTYNPARKGMIVQNQMNRLRVYVEGLRNIHERVSLKGDALTDAQIRSLISQEMQQIPFGERNNDKHRQLGVFALQNQIMYKKNTTTTLIDEMFKRTLFNPDARVRHSFAFGIAVSGLFVPWIAAGASGVMVAPTSALKNGFEMVQEMLKSHIIK